MKANFCQLKISDDKNQRHSYKFLDNLAAALLVCLVKSWLGETIVMALAMSRAVT